MAVDPGLSQWLDPTREPSIHGYGLNRFRPITCPIGLSPAAREQYRRRGMLDQEAPARHQSQRSTQPAAATTPPRVEPLPPLAAPIARSASSDRDDPLARSLQRAVVQRAPLARMLTVKPDSKDNDLIGVFAERHSDEKRLPVDAVIRGPTGITHFKLKLPGTDGKNAGDFVEVSVTDPEYGWANDKASKRNWLRIKAGETAAVAAPTGSPVVAPRDWLADANAPPKTDYDTVFTLPTSRVRYTQDSISQTFSKPTPSGARTVYEAVAALKSRADTLEAMPALMIVPSGKEAVRSFDNRRLWVAKRAQVGKVRVRWASPAERSKNNFKWTGDGKSCRVRE